MSSNNIEKQRFTQTAADALYLALTGGIITSPATDGSAVHIKADSLTVGRVLTLSTASGGGGDVLYGEVEAGHAFTGDIVALSGNDMLGRALFINGGTGSNPQVRIEGGTRTGAVLELLSGAGKLIDALGPLGESFTVDANANILTVGTLGAGAITTTEQLHVRDVNNIILGTNFNDLFYNDIPLLQFGVDPAVNYSNLPFRMYWSNQDIGYGAITIDNGNGSPIDFVAGNIMGIGNIVGNSIIKSGGISSQFLKADGSVDTTAYESKSQVHILQGTIDLTSAFQVSPNVWILDLHADRFPYGINISKIYVDSNVADPTTEIDADLKYCDAVAGGAFPGGSPTVIKAIDTTTGNFADAAVNTTVATGKSIYIALNADPVDFSTVYHFRIHYTILTS